MVLTFYMGSVYNVFRKKCYCYLPIRLFDSIDQHRFVIVDQTEKFIDHFFCEDIGVKTELATPPTSPINL